MVVKRLDLKPVKNWTIISYLIMEIKATTQQFMSVINVKKVLMKDTNSGSISSTNTGNYLPVKIVGES